MNLHQELEKRLKTKFTAAQISVQIQGSSAFLNVVSDEFHNVSRVRREQSVYSVINDLIKSGELHAVTIHAKTPEELTGSL